MGGRALSSSDKSVLKAILKRSVPAGSFFFDGCFHCGNFGMLTDTDFGSAAHIYEVRPLHSCSDSVSAICILRGEWSIALQLTMPGPDAYHDTTQAPWHTLSTLSQQAKSLSSHAYWVWQVLRQMSAITMHRGAQSGGMAVMARCQHTRKGTPTKATRVRVS